MKNLLILNKKEGETPLQALEQFRQRHKKYKDVKMTYAGRLDPIASGLLLVLAGEEVKEKDKYLGLDKEYEFEILFGFATDTHDILGKIKHTNKLEFVRMLDVEKKIKSSLKYFRGKFKQKYPLYSSKTVAGKQLFRYGREDLGVERPEREVEIKSLKFLKIRKISNKKLLSNIEKRIAKVYGDFRQNEIIKLWNKYLCTSTLTDYYLASFKIKCSSGTYVRGIAESLGEHMGIPALAFSIQRTKIGRWGKISL